MFLIVKELGSTLTTAGLLAFFNGQIAKWWKPDPMVFVESRPPGATGKVTGHQLCEQYGDYYLSV